MTQMNNIPLLPIRHDPPTSPESFDLGEESLNSSNVSLSFQNSSSYNNTNLLNSVPSLRAATSKISETSVTQDSIDLNYSKACRILRDLDRNPRDPTLFHGVNFGGFSAQQSSNIFKLLVSKVSIYENRPYST
jgi:hypothetical protein